MPIGVDANNVSPQAATKLYHTHITAMDNHFANIVLHLQRVGTGSIRQSVQNGQFLCCLAQNALDLFLASHADPPANAAQTASSLRSVHATSLRRRPLLQHPTSLPDRQPRLRRFVMNRSKTRCAFARLFPARRNAGRRSARRTSARSSRFAVMRLHTI